MIRSRSGDSWELAGDVRTLPPPLSQRMVEYGRSPVPSGERREAVPSMIDNGRVAYLFIAQCRGEPMTILNKVHAIAGQGLEGDRYFHSAGGSIHTRGTVTEVTLVEREMLEDVRREYGILLDPRDTRRNIVTQGVSLSRLLGLEFLVGAVTLRGISLCEPCAHLEQATQKGVLRALVHRGGLRAQILTSGTIRVGDVIQDQRRRRVPTDAQDHLDLKTSAPIGGSDLDAG